MSLILEPHDPGHEAGDVPVELDEQSFEQKEVAGLSQSQIVRRRFLRHKGAMTSLTLLLLIVVLATREASAGARSPAGGSTTTTP